MKVLLVSGYNPFQKGSGPGNGLYYLSQALADVGCDVHVLTPKLKETGTLGKHVTIHYYNNPLKKTPMSQSWIPFSVFSVSQISRLCDKYKFDVVNGRSPTTFAYSCVHGKQPFVVSAHGTSFGEISSLYTTPPKLLDAFALKDAGIIQPAWATLTKLEYKHASRVVAVSRAVSQELTDYYHIDRKKVVVIPNGVIRCNVNAEPEDENMILSVGRMIWRKGFTFLISAMPSVLKEFPKAKLVLVGSGPYKQRLLEYTSNLGLQSSVTFLESVPREKLFSLYSKARVYVQPSLYEPLGNTVLEAMIMQKPVVACRVGGIPEIITNRENGLLVDTYSSVQLANAIKTLLSDRSYSMKLGAQAKTSVEERFSWPYVAKETLKLYQTLVG